VFSLLLFPLFFAFIHVHDWRILQLAAASF